MLIANTKVDSNSQNQNKWKSKKMQSAVGRKQLPVFS